MSGKGNLIFNIAMGTLAAAVIGGFIGYKIFFHKPEPKKNLYSKKIIIRDRYWKKSKFI
ncbi:MAG: hypothetical protein QGF74_01935 [Candidatus Nanoarchaeia archaeon]|jgi:hypothetical protein|nr:hypothetical protein [Candidatus Nanoarchaeia archaeon]|tara:strand:+ start:34597 stop:34773 length:177 start_codon:yes stop_codon:yes gene_type:complete